MKENTIKALIRRALANSDDVRLFNNPVGQAFLGEAVALKDGSVIIKKPVRITYGLVAGSADLIGWKTIEVTPEMVGKKLAVFLSLEIKRPGQKLRKDQAQWAKQVRKFGGIAGAATSIEEAQKITDDIWPEGEGEEQSE